MRSARSIISPGASLERTVIRSERVKLPLASSSSSASSAGRSPRSSPANAAVVALARRAEGPEPRSPCRPRSAGAAHEPCASGRPRARARRRARRCRSASDSPTSPTARQCTVTAIAPFRSISRSGHRRSASFAASAIASRYGERGGLDHRPAVDPPLQPVLPHQLDAGERDRGREEIEGPAAHDPDEQQPPGEAFEHRERLGRSRRGRRIDDDRSERAVEVEEQGSRVRVRRQHVGHCAGRDHGATLPRVEPKEAARATVEQQEQTLVALSHRIHAHPELCFEEVQSSGWTAGALVRWRARWSRPGVGGLDTAFVARAGSGPLHLGDLRGVRRVAGHRPRVRPQHHRRGRGRRRSRARSSRRRSRADDLRRRHARRGRRRRQDLHARTRACSTACTRR